MGDQAVRYMTSRRKPQKPVSPDSDKALGRLQLEAKQQGATLHSGGHGGLPSDVVLGVMRRDEYRCHKCGGRQDLSLHHKADVLASDYLKRLHKRADKTDPKNLAVICQRCHDQIHENARKEGIEADD